MATAYVYTFDHIETSGGSVEADAQYGDNGPANGPDPEFSLLTASDSDAGRTTWNAGYNADGSWDSGAVPVSFTMAADGNGNDVITWSVNGETALTQTVPSLGDVGAVEIVAGTQTNGAVKWSDVSIAFSDGSTTEAYTGSGDSPAVDTTTADSGVAEQELWVIPTGMTDTSVTVDATVRFTLPPGSYPNPSDLFADLFVTTA